LKRKIFGLMPPATLVAPLLFWANAPKAWFDQWWLLSVVGFAVIAIALMLEHLNQRLKARFHTFRARWALEPVSTQCSLPSSASPPSPYTPTPDVRADPLIWYSHVFSTIRDQTPRSPLSDIRWPPL
jgi:hypothetical protein